MSKYDAMRRLNRAEVRAETPLTLSSIEPQKIEIWENASGQMKKIERTDGLLWLGANATLRVGDLTIGSPMTYCCLDGTTPKEASCIVASLPANGNNGDISLGYWPSYSSMTREQRDRYLRWLASGKRGRLDDVGYAFVYFYGLERRALSDEQDIPWITEETARLLSRYPESRSFRKYLSGFLTYLYAKELESLTEERLIDLYEFSPVPCKTSFQLLLAWYAKKRTALSPKQAFYILRNLPQVRAKDGSTLFPRVMEDMFCSRCRSAYPLGLSLSPSKHELAVEYGAASATLTIGERGRSAPPVKIPNVLGKMSQFKKLQALGMSCLEETELVTVRRGDGHIPGEPLPSRRTAASMPVKAAEIMTEVTIDMGKVAKLMEETEKTASRLSAVFETGEEPKPVNRNQGSEEKAQISTPSTTPLPFPADALSSLDARYREPLAAALENKIWSLSEWANLARRFGLMPNALLESVNAWAEEALGDLLFLEDGGDLSLNEWGNVT